MLDKGTFKDKVIGVYEFSITNIYFQKKHCIEHAWIALSNPEAEDFNEISCYLKISLAVACEGDEQIPLNEGGAGGTEDVMMPASIKKQYR